LSDLHLPIFAVGAQRDHVAPWRSTFKIHLQTETEITYLLTTGGHNAGIISEPGRKGAGYQVMTRAHKDHYVDPEEWATTAPRKEGRWWTEWTAWLAAHSGNPIAPPAMGSALCDAPGTFIFKH
jgi:polyhydroxyalkanoate synthase